MLRMKYENDLAYFHWGVAPNKDAGSKNRKVTLGNLIIVVIDTMDAIRGYTLMH